MPGGPPPRNDFMPRPLPALAPGLLAILFGCAPAPQPSGPGTPAAAGFTVFTDDGAAIGGYDPVAYFEDAAPAPGTDAFTHAWHGATWKFASVAHRDAFKDAPEKYAPQYGGYCAWALGAKDSLAPVDPERWTVVGDKLYLNYDADVQEQWLADRDALITKADANWPAHAGGAN